MTHTIKHILFLVLTIFYLESHSETFTVKNTNNEGQDSLNDAIINSNKTTGPNIINFDIPIANPVITTLTNLDSIKTTVLIDGENHNAAGGRVTISGSLTSTSGLRIESSAYGTTIRDLSIINYRTMGIEVNGANLCIIERNYIGVDYTGTKLAPNGIGIFCHGDINSLTIGGEAVGVGNRNIISGNTTGIMIEGNNSNLDIERNYIGTDSSGKTALANGTGISITASVSGTISNNLISGNSTNGIVCTNKNTFLTISDNNIGTDETGLLPIPNFNGILLSNLRKINDNITTITNNTIAGNINDGIDLTNCASVIIQGNRIGIGSDGIVALPNNGIGIHVNDGSSSNLVGETSPITQANTIANNAVGGVVVNGTTTILNSILSNSIFNNNNQDINLINLGNHHQQPPTLTNSSLTDTELTITGIAPAIEHPGTQLTIQFFENNFLNQINQSHRYLGSDLTDVAPLTPFIAKITNFKASFSPSYISATATVNNGINASMGDTSSFSSSIPASALTVTIAPNIQIVCTNNIIQFAAITTGGAPPYTYEWTGPNGFSVNTNNHPNLIISNPTLSNTGNYVVKVIDTTNISVTSAPSQVVVKCINCPCQ